MQSGLSEAPAGAGPQPGVGQLAAAGPDIAARLGSLDAFRGLVILTMTFVNYLAGVKDIPAWAKHMPEKMEGYTFVDVVFPGFLFIVGVAIPLALHKRMARGESTWSLLKRILVRAASLIFVGVIMVNSSSFSAEATGFSKAAWFLLAYLAVVVLWNTYPADALQRKRQLYVGLRAFAGVVLAGLLLVFRGKNGEGPAVWLQHSWWGILGLIGWAYLVCSLIYLASRGRSVALMGALGFLLALYIGDKHGVLDWLGPIHNFIGIGPVLGSTAADVMMGVLVGNCFVSGSALQKGQRAWFMFVFGVGLYLAGELLRPLHGINKNAATESYALVTGGICCLSFLAVYFLMDMKGWRRWAGPLIPVGQNALLAYLLPGTVANFMALIGLRYALWPFDSSWLGALNAGGLTCLILLITWGATRSGIRLRL